jgi:mannose-1-phosphate guanylyltransferase / phosphomannomutase
VEVPCPDERKGAVMRRLIEHTKKDDVELIEGVRVCRGEDWAAAIPDADRACFHVVAEAGDRGRAQALAAEFRDHIAAWRREAP